MSPYDRIQDPAGLIPADEPVFLLRGQDAYAPSTLRHWAALCRAAGAPAIAALAIAAAAEFAGDKVPAVDHALTVMGAFTRPIAGAIAALTLWRAGVPIPDRRHWVGLVAVAVGCGIGFGVLTALALHRTSSSHGAVVIGLLPAATAIVGWNDPEAVARACEEHRPAAILLEPYPANMGLVPPAPGFLDHLRRVLCRGDEGNYRYLLGWMACAVQRPHRRRHQ